MSFIGPDYAPCLNDISKCMFSSTQKPPRLASKTSNYDLKKKLLLAISWPNKEKSYLLKSIEDGNCSLRIVS